jgi:RNA polymerase sigma-70 factor (ECF subfamily)
VNLRMSVVTDWELVSRARSGDMAAFAELVRRYQVPVTQFCYRMIGSIQDAEEIAQESFVRVYRHLHRIRPQAKFSTFLFGIARNLALNVLRDATRRGRGLTESLETAPQVADEADRPDRAARLLEIEAMIARAMECLSPEHREILVLREINGMDYAAIARVVRCRKGTVKSRLARAREQLRVQLIRLGGEWL